MCLTKKYKTECKTAKADIVCYKVVYKPSSVMKSLILGKRLTDFHFISLYENYFYSLGFRYIEPSFDPNAGETVTKGFHSYVKEEVAHAVFMTIVPNMPENIVMLRCTIPAGAKYYEGVDGDYCSNMIRIDAWKGVHTLWNEMKPGE